MKTTLLSLMIILFFVAGIHAQPVFHATDLNPVAGDRIVSASAKVAGVTIPVAGTNVTWNYSTLKDSTAPFDTTRYVKKSTTPYGSLFPQANLAAKISTAPGDYFYYKTSSTSLQSFGSASATDTVTWSPPYRLVIYPFTYLTNFTDTSTITFKQNGTPFIEKYKDTVKAVGYGTLKLPHNRTFKKVLMVKTTTVISYKVLGQTFTTVSYGISFFVAGYHSPLLSFSLNQANKIVGVSYSKNAAPAAFAAADDESQLIVKNNTAFSLYPNPATTGFTINLNSANDKKITGISITDMNDKNVYSKKTNIISGQSINCSSFTPGIYFVTMQMNDGSVQVEKLVIKK